MREWTDAALTAEFVSRGTSLEAGDPMPPDRLEENFVPFDFNLYGIQRIDQLPKDKVKKLIPAGGTPTENWPFPARADEFITNQTDEVKRIRKIFDAEVVRRGNDAAKLRTFLTTYLINLARTGPERDGINALLRDYPVEFWRDVARKDLPYLGRTAMQQDALRAIGDIAAFLDNDLILLKPENIKKGRAAIGLWAEEMLEYVVPKPVPNSKGVRSEEAMTKYQADKNEVEPALKALLAEAGSDMPDAAKIAQGKTRLTDLSANLATKPAKKMEFLAEIAGNPLKTAEDLAAARRQLLELAQWRARTAAEKEALTGVADLLMPPPFPADITPQDRDAKKRKGSSKARS